MDKILNYISARFNDIDSFGPFEFSEYLEILTIVNEIYPNSNFDFNFDFELNYKKLN